MTAASQRQKLRIATGRVASRRVVSRMRHVKENSRRKKQPPIYNRVFSGNMFLYSGTVSRPF